MEKETFKNALKIVFLGGCEEYGLFVKMAFLGKIG